MRATTGSGRPSAREWLLLALLVAAAGTLRLGALGTEGIDHYDEGVYVANAAALADGDWPPGWLPAETRFWPPLYSWLVHLVLRAGAARGDLAAVAVNAVLGTITIVVLWAFARRWFGPVVAAVAATLLALGPLHVLLSRSALTDVAFALLFLVAVGLLAESQRRDSSWLAVAGGFATGLAFLAKYHGWFALLVAGAALWPGPRAGDVAVRRRRFALWATAAMAAAVTVAPWLLALRGRMSAVGGFAGYYLELVRVDVVGNLSRQVGMHAFLETWWGRASVPCALAAAWFVAPGRYSSRSRDALCAAAAVATALGLGAAGAIAMLALAGVPSLVADRARCGPRIVLAWFGLWLVVAPLHHPYLRLWLPWMVVATVLAGISVARAVDRPATRSAGSLRPGLAAAAIALVAVAGRLVDGAGDSPAPAHRAANAAARIAELVPSTAPLYVLGEPAVAYHLRRTGFGAAVGGPPPEVASGAEEAWFVAGVYARRGRMLERPPFRVPPERVAGVAFEPSDLRLLDDVLPEAAGRYRRSPDRTFELELYRLPAARERVAAPEPR